MSEARVECLDGSLVYVHRNAQTVELVVRGEKSTMTIEAASQLSKLLAHDLLDLRQTIPSEPPRPRLPRRTRRSRRVTSHVSIRELVEANLLPPYSILTARLRGHEYEALITEDGNLMVDDREFDTPSAAAIHATGRTAVSGWIFWRFEGVRISHLRWKLRAERFAVDQFDIAESHWQQKHSIVNRWVEWALTQGIDPGDRDNEAFERFLGERDLNPKTLENYRRYRDEWFGIYDPTT